MFFLISLEETAFENFEKNLDKSHYQTLITLAVTQSVKYEIP